MNAESIQPPIVAFKEWHAVCEALRSGRQSLILRKGGIAEGRDGFAFTHQDFLLFPTHFHAQSEGIRSSRVDPSAAPEPGNRDWVPLTAFCRIVARAVLTDWEAVRRLEPFHIWKNEVLRQRFDYGDHQSIHLAVVKAYRLEEERRLPMEKRFGGCRSWVFMPIDEPVFGLPVLESKAFEELYSDLDNLLDMNVLMPF